MSDDHPHLITRRRGLAMVGAGTGGLLVAGAGFGSVLAPTAEGHDYVADAASGCFLRAEQEEGPFYVAVDDIRSDITLGQSGVPFTIEIYIINSKTCKPLKNAAVDIWHCNASGIYSDIASEDTTGKTFLRGVQFTDKHGKVTFNSIFPGHYSGRTTHVHARIHISSNDDDSKLTGGHICHTGQAFPTQAAYEEVYKLSPYNKETATIVTHAEDRVWTGQHGYTEQMKITMAGSKLSKGLIGSVVMVVDPDATPALIGATSTSQSTGSTTTSNPTGSTTVPSGTMTGGTPPTGTRPASAPTTTGTTTAAATTTT